MKVISVINRKGGVGKTTTALALAGALTLTYKKKTLAIDLDAQCNMSKTCNADLNALSILTVLTGEIPIKRAIQKPMLTDIVPASKGLSEADNILTETGKEYKLKEALEPIASDYDFVIIDTPPALNVLTINALTCSDYVIIPAKADSYSLDAIKDLNESISKIKKYTNPNLKVEGILLTCYDPRTVIGRDVATLCNKLAEKIGTTVFDTNIREAVAVQEAQLLNQSLNIYAPNSTATQDYNAFVKELLQRIN